MREDARQHRRELLLITSASFGVRALAWLAVGYGEIPALYDEGDYLARAEGWKALLHGLLVTGNLDPIAWQGAYGEGHWPPLHPLLLGLAMWVLGSSTAVARFVPVLISTLTTPLLYRLGVTLGGPSIGRRAAWIHVFYPTFVAFSHFLWAESISAFLLVLAAWAALRTVPSPEDDQSRARYGWCAVCGIAGGLGALARAPSAVFLLVLVVWIASRPARRRDGLKAGVLVAGIALAVLLPWLLVLQSEESRIVPLSTLSGFNLALGNNPWIPDGYGSSWGDELSKAEVRAWLDREARDRDTDWRQVAGVLGRDQIWASPGIFAKRALERLRMLWTADVFPLRHLFHAVYPPVDPALARGLSVFLWIGYFCLLGCVLLGSLARLPGKGLLGLLVLMGSLPSAATIGMPRLHMPMLVLLLPIAAAGPGGFKRLLSPPSQSPGKDRRDVGAAALKLAAGMALLAFVISGVPKIGLYLNASNHYGPAIRAQGAWSAPIWTSDRILLRRANVAEAWADEDWRVRIDGTQAWFLSEPLSPGFRPEAGPVEVTWPSDLPILSLVVVARPEATIRLAIERSGGMQEMVEPLGHGWRQWRQLKGGLEVFWSGGGPPLFRSDPAILSSAYLCPKHPSSGLRLGIEQWAVRCGL